MKRIFTLLLLFFSALTFKTAAQTVTCTIHANFSWSADASQSNKIVFHNLSTPANNVNATKWYFGDGTYGNDFNATHTYTSSGTYTVCLIVKKISPSGAVICQDDICIAIHVTVPTPVLCNLVANFQWSPDPNQINKINFTNLSYPLSLTDSIRWTFGDGTSTSTVNASHVYTSPGTYHVCLRVKKKTNAAGTAPCVREICKDIVVYTQCSIVANYTWQTDPQNSLKINFNNTTTPASAATTVSWNFGDGTSSNQWSPSHTYSHGGTYTVCLRVASGNNCVREICKSVVVVEPINCLEISRFETTHSTANCLEYKFEPNNKNTTWQYFWTFGDGTSSTQMIPVHVYAAPGNYNVCLTVIRSATCASTTCKTIQTGLCFSCNNVWAKYNYVRDPSNPNKLYFHAFSNYPLLNQTWTFTRISPASTTPPVVLNQVNPVYTFPTTGYYRVCLRAVTYGNCIKEYCQVIYIGPPTTTCVLSAYPNPATSQVSVNVLLTSPEMIHAYVYNSLNVVMREKHQQGNTGNNLVSFELTGLVPGNYTIKLIYGNRVCYAQFQKL